MSAQISINLLQQDKSATTSEDSIFEHCHQLYGSGVGLALSDGNEATFAEVELNGEKQILAVQAATHFHPQKKYQGSPIELLFKLGSQEKIWVEKRNIGLVLNHPNNTLINPKEFVEYVLEAGANRIFSLNRESFNDLLNLAKKYSIQIDFWAIDPKTGKTLFTHWIGQGAPEITTAILQTDPRVIYQKQSESFLLKSICSGQMEQTNILLRAIKEKNVPLSPLDIWLKNVVLNDDSFQDTDFTSLDFESKKIIYCAANVYGHEKFVERLNRLGMKFSWEKRETEMANPIMMDIVSVKEAAGQFLSQLRSEGRLLTKQQFDGHYSSRKFFEYQNDFDRVLGADHIETTAKRLGIKSIKAPQMLVVVDQPIIPLSINCHGNTRTEGCTIYSPFIEEVDRKLSREEFLDFMNLLEAVGYNDFMGRNYIIGADGIYIIDTEPDNFCNPKGYLNVTNWENLVAEQDQEWAKNEIASRRQRLKDFKEPENNEKSSIYEKVSGKFLFYRKLNYQFDLDNL